MTLITIDGKEYRVAAGMNLLEASLAHGLELPYFCWHPALGSVGACRQCAVKIYKDEQGLIKKKGKIVMACMTPARDGTLISIACDEARAFRAQVIEWLMVNHPHDCPVCDEGGECHLQDMTVMTGHTCRRYRFTKRTHRNQDLGPFINHEMNRCIQCYRCVRFYRDYAGGRDFDVFGAHDHVYFGRHEDGALENEFSGNLVEVCPTGVFTDKTLNAHYARKWDMASAPSVCPHCSVGCNTLPAERAGRLRRVHNRFNAAVNGYFLCDRGRFGYGFVGARTRLRQPLLEGAAIGSEAALTTLADIAAQHGKIVGVGSPRASLEANYALRRLVGPERFFAGVSPRTAKLLRAVVTTMRGGVKAAALADVRGADAAVILGEDLTNSAPVMALALRQAVRQKGLAHAAGLKIPAWDDASVRMAAGELRSPLFIAAPYPTKLDDVAARCLRAAPDDLARFGFAVAGAIRTGRGEGLAREVATALASAERPLVVAGTSLGVEALIWAAQAVGDALSARGLNAGLALVAPECNSVGLALMDAPDVMEATQRLSAGEADTLLVLENDLFRRLGRPDTEVLLRRVKRVVVIDHTEGTTSAAATLLLPAATFAECAGTYVNYEGRAQRYQKVMHPAGEVRESWRWLERLLVRVGKQADGVWSQLDDVVHELAMVIPAFAALAPVAAADPGLMPGERIPREPHRFSGRTAMSADISVHEQPPPVDPDAPLAFSMEGRPVMRAHGEFPPDLDPFYWEPGWNSVQASTKAASGVSGVRLTQPRSEPGCERSARVHDVPPEFVRRPDAWLIVSRPQIFGTEELSALAPSVASRVIEPSLFISAADAARLGVTDRDAIVVRLQHATAVLKAVIGDGVPDGVAAATLPVPGVGEGALPAWARLARAT